MNTLKETKLVQEGKIVVDVPKSFGEQVEVTVSSLEENEEWDYWTEEEIRNLSNAVVKEPDSPYASMSTSSESSIRTIEVNAEKRPLKELVTLVEQGNDVVLMESGKAVARIVSLRKRVMGLHEGMVWTSDDFDAPLPDEFWLGEDENPL